MSLPQRLGPQCHHSRVTSRAGTKTDGKLAIRLAAISSFGAAIIHFAVMPTHWQAWTQSGVFFASIAMFQVLWAFLVSRRPMPAVFAAGILANVAAAALWVMSRTAGVPFGPHSGQSEAVDTAGLCALLLECYVVMGAGWGWYRVERADPISRFGNAIILGGASAVVTIAATLGAASGVLLDHHGSSEAEQSDHPSASDHAGSHSGVPTPAAIPVVEAAPKSDSPAPVEHPAPATELSDETAEDHHHSE